MVRQGAPLVMVRRRVLLVVVRRGNRPVMFRQGAPLVMVRRGDEWLWSGLG